jgi:HPt (histidine-containing phosphotransfer) domain-containing protein
VLAVDGDTLVLSHVSGPLAKRINEARNVEIPGRLAKGDPELHQVAADELVDVVLAFEDEFDIEIADEDVDSVNTVGDCVELIQQKVA